MTTEQLKARLMKISAQAMLWKCELDEMREKLAEEQSKCVELLAGEKLKERAT